mmetsp:Transcript_55006/g.170800  ORF Transcript_55006/g.170800 Transcript_55006/m.170800 type:complete len:286 (-) Transcript_55006:643-1500(-)
MPVFALGDRLDQKRDRYVPDAEERPHRPRVPTLQEHRQDLLHLLDMDHDHGHSVEHGDHVDVEDPLNGGPEPLRPGQLVLQDAHRRHAEEIEGRVDEVVAEADPMNGVHLPLLHVLGALALEVDREVERGPDQNHGGAEEGAAVGEPHGCAAEAGAHQGVPEEHQHRDRQVARQLQHAQHGPHCQARLARCVREDRPQLAEDPGACMDDGQELDGGPPCEDTAAPKGATGAPLDRRVLLSTAVPPPAPEESAQQDRVLHKPDGGGELALPRAPLKAPDENLGPAV